MRNGIVLVAVLSSFAPAALSASPPGKIPAAPSAAHEQVQSAPRADGERDEEKSRPPTLEVVNRFALPAKVAGGLADIRWAGDESVYLADRRTGVVEVKLAEGLPEIRRVAPPPYALRLEMIERVAVSDKWIVMGHLGKIAWKKLGDTNRREKIVLGFFNDFDIDGDELVILGWPPAKQYRQEIYENGGIVWQSDLNSMLDDWDVLYESKEAARLANLNDLSDSEFALGSIRFLKKQGGYVVHPSFIPGVFQLSSSGTVKRQWMPEDLWGKSRNPDGTVVPSTPRNLDAFLTSGHSVDVVLSLPEGPAVIVRSPGKAEGHYRLAVLGPRDPVV